MAFEVQLGHFMYLELDSICGVLFSTTFQIIFLFLLQQKIPTKYINIHSRNR